MDDLQLKHYKVEITEISQKTVSVGALSVEDALRRARQDYTNGHIVLDADDHISTDFDVQERQPPEIAPTSHTPER